MIVQVLSGGQDGVDLAAWKAAKAARILTGGYLPLGFRTESGPKPHYASEFGAVEHESPDYPPRTRANVEAADATLWFGRIESSGFKVTHDAAVKEGVRRPGGYPFLAAQGGDLKPSDVAAWIAANGIKTLNVAGNRESKNPGIGARTEKFLTVVFRLTNGSEAPR